MLFEPQQKNKKKNTIRKLAIVHDSTNPMKKYDPSIFLQSIKENNDKQKLIENCTDKKIFTSI